MTIKALLDDTSRIVSYATVGDIEGSIAIDIPDDTDLSVLSHARWDGNKIIALPVEQPDPEDEITQIQAQLADLQARLTAITAKEV